MLVFIPSIGEFVIPELLCGPDNFDGWEDTLKGAFHHRDWLVASVVTIIMQALLVIPILLFNHYHTSELEE